MEIFETVGGILAIALLLLISRYCLHLFDRAVVESEARNKGWRNVKAEWTPFAPGWFFEYNERHYLVSYRDKNGFDQKRYCKFSLFTGIYWR